MKQGKKAIDGEDCVYRGKDGLRCGIGCLIPNRIYCKELEGGGIWAMYRGAKRGARIALKVIDHLQVKVGSDVSFLSELQDIHDGKAVRVWAARLRDFAHRHDLEHPKCIHRLPEELHE